MSINIDPARVIAIDGRFAVGQRRGIGKGSLEVLRAIVQLPASFRYELLVDRSPEPGLIAPSPNWCWQRLEPGVYPAWEQLALPWYARRHHPDIVHSVGNTAPLAPLGKTKLVVTVHDLIFLEHWRLRSMRQRLGRIYRRLIVPAAIRRADWVITDARAIRDQIVARFPSIAGRISVIGVPVAAEFFDREPAEPSDRPYLIAFSAIDPRKNIARVVEAFQRVRVQLPQSELVLVGSQGPQLGEVAGIRILQYVPEAELRQLIAGSRGLVYASLSEGFGVPILEAMALGAPVITSNRPPMDELAGSVALLVDPSRGDAIADAMSRLLTDDGLRRRLSSAGRSRAEQFRPSSIAQQTAELYGALAE